MNKDKYMEVFIDESNEHLQSLNDCLMELEKDPENKAVLNEIFRVAHTLKGMAGTMGYNRMAKLTHDMENVLQALRNNEINVEPALIDTLFNCMDALETYLNNITGTGSEGENDYYDVIKALNQALAVKEGKNEPSKTASPIIGARTNASLWSKAISDSPDADSKINVYEASVIKKAESMGVNAFSIKITLSKDCVLKSARAFVIFKTIEKYAEIIKSEPIVEDIEDEKFDNEFTVLVLSKETDKLLSKEVNSISEVTNVEIKQIRGSELTSEDSSMSGESSKASESALAAGNKESDESKSTQSVAKTAAQTKNIVTKTLRVDIDRLDALMNLVGELIITKTRLKGLDDINATQQYNETIEYLERITTGLNDAVMKVRMVPVEAVFNRFPKMIRSISKELGKDIELEMTGIETELDKTLIDEIGDPLVHLLRNSVDHGVEAPERRKELGKPEAGKIALRAYQEGNNVVIEVEDDGQGINVDKIRGKAIEKGFMSQEAAYKLTSREVIDLLFIPSFSTADKITDISGRGVGLDVVKTKIEEIGGYVDVESEYGKGSRFIIRLPLTLAIIQALLVTVADEEYAIPLGSINRIINITENEIKCVQKQEVLLVGESLIPIVRLDSLLEVPRETPAPKHMTVVVVKRGERQHGVLVDSVIGQQEIVQKALGKLLSGLKLITGATIMGNGDVALILDANALA